LNFHEIDSPIDGSGIMDALSLSILGALLGHPAMVLKENGYPKKTWQELEELDNAFDDAAYARNWRPWEWEPGLCINCCQEFKDAGSGDCQNCGWLQGS
jgi:hypothetical protein